MTKTTLNTVSASGEDIVSDIVNPSSNDTLENNVYGNVPKNPDIKKNASPIK